MKTYRKPSGVVIVLQDNVPVNPALVRIADRPSLLHTLATDWATDPMNPAVCWRLKTQPEQDVEKHTELQAFLDAGVGKAIKAVALVGIDKGLWTMTELRAKYRSI